MPFEIIAEIEPATKPDLNGIRRQIAVLAPVVDAFLIPDNHLGRATVSSLAVAHEVAAMGGRSIACLNARDRNLLGFKRDLLTAAAYGVSELLLVRGDRTPDSEGWSLRVRQMIEEIRATKAPFRVGLAAQVGSKLPAWKREADFLVTQICFAPGEVTAWRQTIDFDGPVHAGVLVLASAAMARRLATGPFGFVVPPELTDRLDADSRAGIDIALHCLDALAADPGIAGAHLVPGTRYREVAMSLLARGSGRWG